MSRITQTPVRSSPAMIARSIGAAPRQRGSSEGWTLSIGHSESSGSRISWPKAQTTTASGSAARIRSSAASLVDVRRLQQLDPQLAGGLGGRRRLQLAAPRPWRRSGGVTTSAGRWGEPARRRRTVAAKSEVPR